MLTLLRLNLLRDYWLTVTAPRIDELEARLTRRKAIHNMFAFTSFLVEGVIRLTFQVTFLFDG